MPYSSYQPTMPQMSYQSSPAVNHYTGSTFNGVYGTYTLQNQITRVNGRNGAEAFNLPPNSSVLLLDETQPVVWLKQTDGGGYPTLTGYNITPIETQPTSNVDISAFEQRLSAVERKVENYGKPNSSGARRNANRRNEQQSEQPNSGND